MSINVGTALAYLDLDTSKFTSGLKSAYDSLKIFKDSTASTSDRLLTVGASAKKAGSMLTLGITTPLLGAGAAIIKTASQFESAMAEVAAISGATSEDLELLTEKAKEMGATTKFSASESAEALKYMAMAGWDTQKMLDGLPGIMNLAAASGEDLGTVSDIVTDAMTAFGLSADKAAHFSDVLAQASNRSNTSVGLMGETFKYVAPVAGSLGYTIEDMAVAIGLMANNGIKGSQAGTQLRAVLSRMAKPTDEVAGLMDELGLSLTDSEGNMLSFNEIMLKLRESFSGMTAAEKAQNAAILGGQEAMSGLLAIVNTTDADFDNLTAAINDAEGAAQTMSDVMLDNFGGQLTILKSTIEGIAISFGDIMLPAIKSITRGLQNFATWLNNLSEGQKTVIVWVASLVASLGPLLLIFGKILTFVGSIGVDGVGLLKFIPKLISAITTINAPILAIIAAVVALKLAWDNNFAGIQEKTAAIWATLQETFTRLVALIQNILGIIVYIWQENWFGVQNIFSFVMGQLETIFSGAMDLILLVLQAFRDLFQGNWSGLWNTLVQLLLSILQTMLSLVRQQFQGIVSLLLALGTPLFEAGKSIYTFLWDGLKSIWDSISSWVTDCVNWLVDKVTFWKNESAKVNQGDSGGTPHASGLDYVPYDGYRAILHEGEAVLTKQENREKNKHVGGDTFNFYSPEPIDAVRAAREFRKVKQQLAEDLL